MGKIIALEDVKTSKFLQKKNIKSIQLNNRNMILKLKIQTKEKAVIALDLTGTMTWKALNGTITINNAPAYNDIILLRPNQFEFKNGSCSDQDLLNYITSSLDLPKTAANAIKPVISAPQPIADNIIPRVLPNTAPPLLGQPIQVAISSPVPDISSNSESKRFIMPRSFKLPLESFKNTVPSNPFLPSNNRDQPNSCKQIYNMNNKNRKRSFNSIIDDIVSELKKKSKVEISSMLTQDDDENEAEKIHSHGQPNNLDESSFFSDNDLSMDFKNESMKKQPSLISDKEATEYPKEQIDNSEINNFVKASDLSIEVEKEVIEEPVISSDDVVLIDEKKTTTRKFQEKMIELSSEVIFVENSIYNTSFQDA